MRLWRQLPRTRDKVRTPSNIRAPGETYSSRSSHRNDDAVAGAPPTLNDSIPKIATPIHLDVSQQVAAENTHIHAAFDVFRARHSDKVGPPLSSSNRLLHYTYHVSVYRRVANTATGHEQRTLTANAHTSLSVLPTSTPSTSPVTLPGQAPTRKRLTLLLSTCSPVQICPLPLCK